MSLVKSLSDENDGKADRQAVLVFAFMGQRSRDCVSLFSRCDITEVELSQLLTMACEVLKDKCHVFT